MKVSLRVVLAAVVCVAHAALAADKEDATRSRARSVVSERELNPKVRSGVMGGDKLPELCSRVDSDLCRLARAYYVRGMFDASVALSVQVEQARTAGNETHQFYWGNMWRCLAEAASIQQVEAIYEKFEQAHPERWNEPAANLFLDGVGKPLCDQWFKRMDQEVDREAAKDRPQVGPAPAEPH